MPTDHPVLYRVLQCLWTWEQHGPGGCRCVCRLYHDDPGGCLKPADPGYLLRIVAPANPVGPGDISEALTIARPATPRSPRWPVRSRTDTRPPGAPWKA